MSYLGTLKPKRRKETKTFFAHAERNNSFLIPNFRQIPNICLNTSLKTEHIIIRKLNIKSGDNGKKERDHLTL